MKDKKVVTPVPADLIAAHLQVAPVVTVIFVVAVVVGVVGVVAKLCGFVNVSMAAAFIALWFGLALYRLRERITDVMAEKIRTRDGTHE